MKMKFLILKEMNESLKSYKFIIVVFTCFLLIGFSIFQMYGQYKQKVDSYAFVPNTPNEVYYKQQPNIMSIFVEGTHRLMGRTFVYKEKAFEPQELSMGINLDFYRQLFPVLDFTYVVKIILSFVAMILGFDIICGEKQLGTLKLILSNNVSRVKVFLAKIIGNFSILIIPLSFMFGFYILIVSLIGGVSLSVELGMKLLALLVFSVLFLFLFFLLAVIISALTDTPKKSIVASFVVWVCLVFFIPNVSSFVSQKFNHIPNYYKIEQEKKESQIEIEKNNQNLPSNKLWQMKFSGNNKIMADYRIKINSYVRSVLTINRFSPVGLYTKMTSNLADCGLNDEHDLREVLYDEIQKENGRLEFSKLYPLKPVIMQRMKIKDMILDVTIFLFLSLIALVLAHVFFVNYDVR